MPKFSVGELVVIGELERHEGDPGVSNRMLTLRGKVGTVTGVWSPNQNHEQWYDVLVPGCAVDYTYPESWLNPATTFKVGDEVRVVASRPDDAVTCGTPYWVPEMDPYAGKVGRVWESCFDGCWGVQFDNGRRYAYRPHWLEPVGSRPADNTPSLLEVRYADVPEGSKFVAIGPNNEAVNFLKTTCALGDDAQPKFFTGDSKVYVTKGAV